MAANADRVEKLTEYLTEAAAECFELDDVNASDVVSALFSVLDRTLRGIRKLEDPSERFHNAEQLNKILTDMLVEFGRVPS
jgi:hypothetical protein